MRANEHDLNSLRGMIRRLQEENASLKKLLDENNILYNVSNLVVPMYFLWTQTTRNTFERRELYITE